MSRTFAELKSSDIAKVYAAMKRRRDEGPTEVPIEQWIRGNEETNSLMQDLMKQAQRKRKRKRK